MLKRASGACISKIMKRKESVWRKQSSVCKRKRKGYLLGLTTIKKCSNGKSSSISTTGTHQTKISGGEGGGQNSDALEGNERL